MTNRRSRKKEIDAEFKTTVPVTSAGGVLVVVLLVVVVVLLLVVLVVVCEVVVHSPTRFFFDQWRQRRSVAESKYSSVGSD